MALALRGRTNHDLSLRCPRLVIRPAFTTELYEQMDQQVIASGRKRSVDGSVRDDTGETNQQGCSRILRVLCAALALDLARSTCLIYMDLEMPMCRLLVRIREDLCRITA